MPDETTAPAAPVLRVVTPDATAEEIAALVAVLASLAADRPVAPRPVPEWSARHRAVRRTVAPTRLPTLVGSPGGWRSSGLPR